MNKVLEQFKSFTSSGHGFALVIIYSSLAILFVLFRMKVVEVGYEISEINKKVDREISVNKDLKAQKAELLSVKNLTKLANRHHLYRPKQKQIIVVPTEK